MNLQPRRRTPQSCGSAGSLHIYLVQGKGIGALLGRAAIGKAAELGAKKLYLESNTILEPAIHIYRKLGFKKIAGRETEYQRCNIQMELTLNK